MTVGDGAPSRGNTLLNAYGVTLDLLPFKVHAAPANQGHQLPGPGISIERLDRLPLEPTTP